MAERNNNNTSRSYSLRRLVLTVAVSCPNNFKGQFIFYTNDVCMITVPLPAWTPLPANCSFVGIAERQFIGSLALLVSVPYREAASSLWCRISLHFIHLMKRVIFEDNSHSSDQKFFISYGIQKIIVVFTGAQTWNLSLASTLICTHVLFYEGISSKLKR